MRSAVPSKTVKFLAALLLLGIVLPVAWCWSHPRALSLAECRQYYTRARTRADTDRIDGIVPERAGRAQSALRCGDLRRAYPDPSPSQ